MPNRSFRLSLLVAALMAMGCRTDEVFIPMPPVLKQPAFARLLIWPTIFTLSTVAPGDTLQLTIWAYDAVGARLSGTGAAIYTSSDPSIASVSRTGLVTAAAPGTAEITAALTLGGVSLTATMTVRVENLDYSNVTGVYDLTASIKDFDPAWGNLDDVRYEAVLALSAASGPPWLGGTYRLLQLIYPSGENIALTATGNLTPFYDDRGRLIIALGDRQTYGLTLIVATLAPEFIDGTFGCCGHISGTFEARRRRP